MAVQILRQFLTMSTNIPPKANNSAGASYVFAENIAKMTYQACLMKDNPSIQKSDINK